MASNPREFSCVDPFGVTWQIHFLWHQVGVSIRHADTIDCKFHLKGSDEEVAKVVAIPHPTLQAFAREQGRDITDAWVIHLSGAHLRYMVESGEDMDKGLVTMGLDDLRRGQNAMAA